MVSVAGLSIGVAQAFDHSLTQPTTTASITPAPLAITADDKSKVYGAALPTLTASYSGFVSRETSADLTTLPILSTTVTVESHVSGSRCATPLRHLPRGRTLGE